jgi:hypothetical protein
MRIIIVFLICISAYAELEAQNFYAYRDSTRQNLYCYIDGYTKQMNDQPIAKADWKFGYSFAAWITFREELNINVYSSPTVLTKYKPDLFNFSGNMLVWERAQKLFCYWNGRISTVANPYVNYKINDSIIAFNDYYSNYFKVFYNGGLLSLENIKVDNYQVGKNIIAYTTPRNQFRAFISGYKHDIDSYLPDSFKVGMNTVAYIDNANRFKVYWKDSLYEMEDLRPQAFWAGDDLAAWVNSNNELWVFCDGKKKMLEMDFADQIHVKDQFLWYTNGSREFKVFHKNKDYILEFFNPTEVKAKNHILCWLGQYNHLKVFKNGEYKDVSESIVTDFDINGDVVVYKSNLNDFTIVDSKGEKISTKVY